MTKMNSEGKCPFCDKTFKKAGINRHMATHLAAKTVQGKPGTSFHLKVELDPRWGAAPYFISLWVDGEADLGDLDAFLRDIWLECCGHMSSFRDTKHESRGGMFDFFHAQELMEQGKIKKYEQLMETSKGELPMSRKIKDTLKTDQKLEYQYDFGSTNQLLVTVMDHYKIKADKPIVLLSRNEPLAMLCASCGKTAAETLCSVCYGYEDEGIFCKKCAKKHTKTCEDFADYAEMAIVNSPRMGVCAYEGGSIDMQRDGIANPKTAT